MIRVALLCILLGLTQAQYHQCKDLFEGASDDTHEYHEHVFTRRGFKEMEEVMPYFLDLSALYAAKSKEGGEFRVLEQGCGSARGLLEAQSQFPAIRMHGVNFEGYGIKTKQKSWGQTDGSRGQLLQVAKHFKIPLMCGLDEVPVLPVIYLTPSLADPDFEYPFPSEFFDLIVSRDSLNSMKLRESESHVYIPTMLTAMKKEGGMAALHLEYGANLMYPQLTGKNFTICAIYNVLYEESRVSIMVYKGEDNWHGEANFYKSWFGIVMKRCKTEETNISRDCIVPEAFRAGFIDDMNTFKKPMNSEKVPVRDEASVGRIKYSFLYMEHLIRVLDVWQANGNIFT